mgnify:FL=1
MPDETLKTYPEILAYLQAKKNRKINLLFGNGFSMGFAPQIFSYNALSNFVKDCDDPTVKKLFRIVGTTNFELIMRNLDMFVQFAKEFTPEVDVASVIEPAKSILKTKLLEAITALHPEHVFEVPEEKSLACANFLKPYLDSKGSIFSTNYDLLLYWVLMHHHTLFGDNMRDGFLRGDGRDLEWESGAQNIYYLHGSLPLFDLGGCIIKEEYSFDKYLLQNIKKRIDQDQYPIFVTAGTAAEKMDMISHNRYLSYCYDHLANLDGSLIVIGFNFGKYDTHIIDAINQAATERKGRNGLLCSLFLGYFNDADKAHLTKLIPDFKVQPDKIRLFDVKTANVWGE